MTKKQISPSNENSSQSHRLQKTLCDLLATGFYSGRSKIAPGTTGSVVATLLAWLMFHLYPELAGFVPSALIALGFTLGAVAIATKALHYQLYGPEVKDPQQIVIDEFAGYLFAIVGLGPSLLSLGIGFVLFRLFDILKPPPIRKLEELPRGLGIVIDDVAAGIYANLAQRFLFLFF